MADPSPSQPSPAPLNVPSAPTTGAGAPPEASSSTEGSVAKGKARDVRVWMPSNDARPPPLPDLPDSYFAPTASEAQKAFSGQQAARERLTDAPMLTKTLRDREEKAKKEARYKKYPLGRMRIRFADRMMLEGTLPSTARIRDLYDFVKLHLAIPEADFVLYQTPPKREFKPLDPKINTLSLLELQLAPAALFYIKFADDRYNSPSQSVLEPSVRALAAPLPPPPSFQPEMVADSDSGKGKPNTVGSSGSREATKVPKWLKSGIGGKK